jgi:small GTP-binding protein
MEIQKKICLLGDFAVGKTSLVRRYIEDRFDERYMSTIGVKISRKVVEHTKCALHFILWDMTGSDSFRVQASYLQGAAGAIVVCDMTRKDTLYALERYARQVRERNAECRLIFVGNKVDLTELRQLKESEVEEVAALFGCPVLFTSAKTGQNVEEAFLELAMQLESGTSFSKPNP